MGFDTHLKIETVTDYDAYTLLVRSLLAQHNYRFRNHHYFTPSLRLTATLHMNQHTRHILVNKAFQPAHD